MQAVIPQARGGGNRRSLGEGQAREAADGPGEGTDLGRGPVFSAQYLFHGRHCRVPGA